MDIKKGIITLAKAMGANFTLNGQTITYEEVFSEVGLLPAIARRADQLCALCLGYGIGISFEETENAKLGVKVSFDEVTPNSLRYLTIADVLAELIYSAPSRSSTPLDELLYD